MVYLVTTSNGFIHRHLNPKQLFHFVWPIMIPKLFLLVITCNLCPLCTQQLQSNTTSILLFWKDCMIMMPTSPTMK